MTWDGKPALGPDWWEEWETQNGIFGWDHLSPAGLESVLNHSNASISMRDNAGDTIALDPVDRHMAAALCLHEQEFGFTREDVEALEGVEFVLNDLLKSGRIVVEDKGLLLSIARRIAALLPPEAK